MDKHMMSTGPVAIGWHRVSWTEMNTPKYILTEDIISAVLAHAALEGRHTVSDLKMESWDQYAYNTRPTILIKKGKEDKT